MSDSSGTSLGPLSGWEADAPPHDSIFRQFLLSQSAFQQLVGGLLGATVVSTDRYVAVDTGRPAPFVNVALLRQPLFGDELDRTMTELEAIFASPGATGTAVIYSPLPTADLRPWNWTLSGHPPLQLRSPFTPTIDTSHIRVEPVSTNAQLNQLERVMIEGFDMTDMRGLPPNSLVPEAIIGDSRFRAWLGYLDGEPVAGASSMTDERLVDVIMVATLPSARRKGFGLAVTQAASRPELGLPAVLLSSDEGRPVYERLGFVPIMRGAFWYRVR